jgi:hypothetical protein
MITTIDGRMSPNLETPKQKNYEQRQIIFYLFFYKFEEMN